jgi:hypothetical protein
MRVLALGEVIHRYNGVVTTGTQAMAIKEFIETCSGKLKANVNAFIPWAKACSLLPRNFYYYDSRNVAVNVVGRKIKYELSHLTVWGWPA